MQILIDARSGCCNGVSRAIETAEKYLTSHQVLYSLGSIVHNAAEIDRLAQKGLMTVSYADLPQLQESTVLIRAHGEPPETYITARKLGIRLIDCTCPVVLSLQRKIAAKYAQMQTSGGQILIFGKLGHAEVNGLVGQTGGAATVIENLEDLKRKIQDGTIDTGHPLALFSQTTKDPDEFAQVAGYLTASSQTEVHNTICRHVSSRHKGLKEFAAKCTIVIFVSGKESSNGKVLFELCRSTNPRSYKIENAEELPGDIFRSDDVVGICGATSTTRWQLERVAETIASITLP